MISLVLAFASAAVFAVATVLQHRSASAVPSGHGGAWQLFLRLGRQPRWLLGKGADFVAFGLQAVALSRGSFIVVQSVLASGVVLALLVEARLDHRRPAAASLIGSGVLLIGVLLIVGVGRPHGGRPSPPPWLFVAVAIITVAIVGGALLFTRNDIGTRAAVTLGLGGGICFSIDAAFIRTGSRRIGIDGMSMAVLAAAFGFIVFGVLGNILVQRAFQLGSLRIVLPALTAIEPLAALAFGHVLFDERLHKTLSGRLGGYGGMALLVIGVIITQTDEAVVATTPPAVLQPQS